MRRRSERAKSDQSQDRTPRSQVLAHVSSSLTGSRRVIINPVMSQPPHRKNVKQVLEKYSTQRVWCISKDHARSDCRNRVAIVATSDAGRLPRSPLPHDSNGPRSGIAPEWWDRRLAMIRLLGPTSRLCDGLNRRELLRIGGLSLGGLTLPGLLDQAAVASRPVREFRQGQELHRPVPLRRCFPPRHVRSQARCAGRDPRRVRHDRHGVAGRSVLQILAADRKAGQSSGDRPLDDAHVFWACDRRLRDVHRPDVSQDRERGEFHGAFGSASHRIGTGEDRSRVGADVPVHPGSAPARRRQRSSRRPVGGIARQQVRPDADRRRPESRRLPAGEPSAAGERAPDGTASPAEAGRSAQSADSQAFERAHRLWR